MKRRIVRGINYLTAKAPTLVYSNAGSNSIYAIEVKNDNAVSQSNYRMIQAYLFKRGGAGTWQK